jgi:NAD(P)-dependent dehydrogenase (short-subunit alcohol dehydrogenase family)
MSEIAELDNKCAIIAGGSGDIGSAIALRLAELGANVSLAGRTQTKLDAVAERIRKATGRTVLAAPYDLRHASAPATLVDRTIAQFGRLDIVVTCAGDFKRGGVASTPRADWEDGFALMFHGAVSLVSAAWPHLKSGAGHVVMISGLHGVEPHGESIIGGAICAALLNFAKAASQTGRLDGVSVNCVVAGYLQGRRLNGILDKLSHDQGIARDRMEQTFASQLGVRRLGTPQDVANVVELLVSEKGSYLQGSSIVVDGGVTHGI